MELAAYAPWGERWQEFNLEQQIHISEAGCDFVLPEMRQTEFYLTQPTILA